MKEQILKLKTEKNAVILAHYYAPAEIQEVADFVGDSFFLAKAAKQSDADIIVFCGVSFMGESAKILCPDKKVLMPDLTADCPMAHMVEEGLIDKMKEKYEDLAVVCYINSTAELKCQSDVCVTSSNAVKIVNALEHRNIFFIPDKNLGRFVAAQVPDKRIILNEGCCPLHAGLTPAQVTAQKDAHPDALVLAHPECSPELLELADFIGSTAEIILNEGCCPLHAGLTPAQVTAQKEVHPAALVLAHPECSPELLELADFIGSTAEIIDFAKKSEAGEFIIVTEEGVDFRLCKDNPEKKFYFPAPSPCCKDMKLNTLESLLDVLIKEDKEVVLSEDVINGALVPLNRMLELGK